MTGNTISGGEGFRPFMDQLREDMQEAEKWAEDYLVDCSLNRTLDQPLIHWPTALCDAYRAGLKSGRKGKAEQCCKATKEESVPANGRETVGHDAPHNAADVCVLCGEPHGGSGVGSRLGLVHRWCFERMQGPPKPVNALDEVLRSSDPMLGVEIACDMIGPSLSESIVDEFNARRMANWVARCRKP